MLCVDLKNSFYQLPDVHRGLYDLDNYNVEEELLGSSTNVETIRDEEVFSNDFFLDLTKQEKSIGKFFFTLMPVMFNYSIILLFIRMMDNSKLLEGHL